MNKQKGILDLNLDELKAVIESNKLPDNVTLGGLEGREDFAKLFRFRASPASIATALLKEKLQEAKSEGSDPAEIKRERLKLKERELEIKRLKVETQTTLLKRLLEEMKALHLKVDSILIRMSKEEKRA